MMLRSWSKRTNHCCQRLVLLVSIEDPQNISLAFYYATFFNLVNNAGVQSRLLTISGTIPIKYQGAVYNIPIELFIPERYPQEAPKVYVRPTSSKISL